MAITSNIIKVQGSYSAKAERYAVLAPLTGNDCGVKETRVADARAGQAHHALRFGGCAAQGSEEHSAWARISFRRQATELDVRPTEIVVVP